MNERQLQFRVGLFVVVSLAIGAGVIVQFGSLKSYWEKQYALAVHFDVAPGLRTGVPVQLHGISIGLVREVRFDAERGGVLAVLDIDEQYRLRKDTQAALKRSLLGDTSIEFTAGVSPDPLPPGSLLEGAEPLDPMRIVQQFDARLSGTMASFEATTREWQKVGGNLNALLDTNRGNIAQVLEKTVHSLDAFAATMAQANEALAGTNKVLADPEYQENLRTTLAALPEIAKETQETVAAIRQTVVTMDASLANLKDATDPLAQKSGDIVARLDRSMASFESTMADLNRFSKLLVDEDGSIQRFASDPELYRNLATSAGSMAVVLKSLEPTLRDLRIFADKIARHPELLGVGGMVNGSSGIKAPEDGTARQAETPKRGFFSRN